MPAPTPPKPRTPPGTSRQMIHGVEDALWLKAKILALKRGITLSQVVNDALREYLEGRDEE